MEADKCLSQLEMSRNFKNRIAGPGIVAACVAAAGTVAAITFFILKRTSSRPAAVLNRCGKAVKELERRSVCA